MKQRKLMRGWQFGIIIALLVVMLSTMFMPAITFSESRVTKVVESVQKDIKNSTDEIGGNDEAKKSESYSPFIMMTKSKLTYDIVNTKAKVMMWVAYGLLLAVLIVTVLSFLLKWSKYISLITTAVYGAAATGIFGYMRFFYLKSLAKLGGLQETLFGKALSGITKILTGAVGKGLTELYSFGFMVAFIIAILILVVSIVFMFIGNPKKAEDYEDEEYDDNYAEDYKSLTGGDATVDWTSMQTEAAEEIPMPPKKQAKPIMQKRVGQVVCTKGISCGQGLMLPEEKKVIVGKSTRNANLVISNQKISNIHCSIRYNATRNTYTVKDHSTNGTYVNKVRLPKDTAMEYPAGTILSFADGNDEVTLR